ncbi:hypothetical protein D9M71_489230 [compost metagenome]
MLVRKRCHGSDIGHLHVRVGRCFEVDHLGLPADRRFKRLQVSHVDMADLDPELTDAVVQKGKGAAVQSTPYQHLITWPQQGPQGRSDCAHPRSQGQPRLTAFKRGHALFQQGQGGVGNACIEMSALFPGKAGCAVLNRRKRKRGGLVDRWHQRTLVGQWVVTVVDGTGSET